MRSIDDRSLEDLPFEQVGRVDRALAGPKRLEMLEMPNESGVSGTRLCATKEPP